MKDATFKLSKPIILGGGTYCFEGCHFVGVIPAGTLKEGDRIEIEARSSKVGRSPKPHSPSTTPK